MNISPPEKRRCEACTNTMTLNLFSLNSSVCRYCQEGMAIPARLISNIQEDNPIPLTEDPKDIVRSETEDVIKNDLIDNGKIEN